MSRTTRYPLRLLTEPIPAEALIDGVWTTGVVTAWAAKAAGWHAWFRVPDGRIRLVHQGDVRPARDTACRDEPAAAPDDSPPGS